MIATPPNRLSQPKSPDTQSPIAQSPLVQSPIAQPAYPPGGRAEGEPESVAALLTRLRALDIHLWLEDERLRYNATKGAMTPALTAELR